MSQSWLDYTGLSSEQGMGWGWASVIHPEDVDRVVANWRAALASGSARRARTALAGAQMEPITGS